MPASEHQEIECNFIDVDPKEFAKKLEQAGAKKVFDRRLFKRYVFDFPGFTLNDKKSWLRLRDEGDKIMLAYKQRLGVKKGANDKGMKEVEVKVDSLENTKTLLESLGMIIKFYEENYRTAYELDGVEVTIDEWPLIPAYVEIEGDSWDKVKLVSEKLGFDYSQKLICSGAQIYQHYGINEHDYKILTFNKQVKR